MSAKIMPLLVLITFAMTSASHRLIPKKELKPNIMHPHATLEAQKNSKNFNNEKINSIQTTIKTSLQEKSSKKRAQIAEELLALASDVAQEKNKSASMQSLENNISSALTQLLPNLIAQATTIQELNAVIKKIYSVDPLYFSEPSIKNTLNNIIDVIEAITNDLVAKKNLVFMKNTLEAINIEPHLLKSKLPLMIELIETEPVQPHLQEQQTSYQEADPQKLLAITRRLFSLDISPNTLNLLITKLEKINFEALAPQEIEQYKNELIRLLNKVQALEIGKIDAHVSLVKQFKSSLETALVKAKKTLPFKQPEQLPNTIQAQTEAVTQIKKRLNSVARKKPSLINISPKNLSNTIVNDISSAALHVNDLEKILSTTEKIIIKPIIEATTIDTQHGVVLTTKPYQKIYECISFIEKQKELHQEIIQTLQAIEMMNANAKKTIDPAIKKVESLINRLENNKKILEQKSDVLKKNGFSTT